MSLDDGTTRARRITRAARLGEVSVARAVGVVLCETEAGSRARRDALLRLRRTAEEGGEVEQFMRALAG